MHFDALTLAAVADELRETVAGGRVQKIVLPDSRSVALEIYAHQQRRHLLLSAHPQASRVHLLEHKPRRGMPKETPLLLLLRKYVRGARLESVELPAPVRAGALPALPSPPARCIHPRRRTDRTAGQSDSDL